MLRLGPSCPPLLAWSLSRRKALALTSTLTPNLPGAGENGNDDLITTVHGTQTVHGVTVSVPCRQYLPRSSLSYSPNLS